MKALVIVDMQNDFMPWGTMAVPQSDKIIPVINALISHFSHVLATLDYHPADHVSFAINHGKRPQDVIELKGGIEQILWPVHCVQGTMGAEFVFQIPKEKIEIFFEKGKDPKVDSYSAFFDNAKKHATGLADYLKEKRINELYFTGVATDFCVKYSVLDALSLGIKVYLVTDATKGVNLEPDGVQKALDKMQENGAQLITSKEILQ